MRKLNDTLLLERVHEGYCTALSMVGRPGFAGGKQGQENRLLSAKFVWEVSNNIHGEIFDEKYYLNVIKVDDNGKKEAWRMARRCLYNRRKKEKRVYT